MKEIEFPAQSCPNSPIFSDSSISINTNNLIDKPPKTDHFSLSQNKNVEFSTKKFRPMCIAIKDDELDHSNWKIDVDYLGESESLHTSDELDIQVLYLPEDNPGLSLNPDTGHMISCNQGLDINHCSLDEQSGKTTFSGSYFQGDANRIKKSKNVTYSQSSKNTLDISMTTKENYVSGIHILSPDSLDISNVNKSKTECAEGDWEISIHQDIVHELQQGNEPQWEVTGNYEHMTHSGYDDINIDIESEDDININIFNKKGLKAPSKNRKKMPHLKDRINAQKPYKRVNKPSSPQIRTNNSPAGKRSAGNRPMLPTSLRERKIKNDHVKNNDPPKQCTKPKGPSQASQVRQHQPKQKYNFHDGTDFHYFFLVPTCPTSAVGDVLDPIIAKLIYLQEENDFNLNKPINLRDRRIVSAEVSTGCNIYLPIGDKLVWFRGIKCYRVGIRGKSYDDIAIALEILDSVAPQLIHRAIFPEKINGLTRRWHHPSVGPIVRKYNKPYVLSRKPHVNTRHYSSKENKLCYWRGIETLYCSLAGNNMNQSCSCKYSQPLFNRKSGDLSMKNQCMNDAYGRILTSNSMETSEFGTSINPFEQDICVMVSHADATKICEIKTHDSTKNSDNQSSSCEKSIKPSNDENFSSKSDDIISSFVHNNKKFSLYLNETNFEEEISFSGGNDENGKDNKIKIRSCIKSLDKYAPFEPNVVRKEKIKHLKFSKEEIIINKIELHDDTTKESKIKERDEANDFTELQNTIEYHQSNVALLGLMKSDEVKTNPLKILATKNTFLLSIDDIDPVKYEFPINISKSIAAVSSIYPQDVIRLLVAEDKNKSIIECSLTDHSVRLFRHRTDGQLKCLRLKAITEKFKLSLKKSEAVSYSEDKQIVRTHLEYEKYPKLLKAFKIIASLI